MMAPYGVTSPAYAWRSNSAPAEFTVVIACSSALLTAFMPPTTAGASDGGSGVTSLTPGHTAVAVDPAGRHQ